MKGIALTALLVHFFMCQTAKCETCGVCHIFETEYGKMKEFFDCWSTKPGVRLIGIPKAFNWIIKRQLKKEIKDSEGGDAFIKSVLDGLQGISLFDYEKLDKNDSLKLEGEIAGFAGGCSESPDYCIILSGRNEEDGCYSRLVLHSKESRAFIILMGKFSKDICTNQSMP